MSKGSSSENPRSTWNFLWRGKTDLDRLIWLLSIDDHGLVWLHIYELIFDLLDRFQGKFLIFSHFKFMPPAPSIDHGGNRLRRRGYLFLYQRDLRLRLLMLHEQLRDGVNAVHVLDIVSDPNGTRLEYEPDHPDANEQGYVAYPNVNVMREMVDLISATRAYEANVTAINSSKDMALRALQIGRV